MNEMTQRERFLLAYGLSGLIIFGGFVSMILGRIDIRDLITLIAMAGGFVGLSLMPGAARNVAVSMLLVALIGGCKVKVDAQSMLPPQAETPAIEAQLGPQAGYATDYLILAERGSNPLPALGKPGIYVPTGGYPQSCKSDGTTCFDPAAIPVGSLPTAIPAPNIANGTVSNLEFQTLDGIPTGSSLATQLAAKQDALTLPLSVAQGGTNSTTALNNNRPLVSSGGKIVETATSCSSSQVLVGGTPPACGGVPFAALPSANVQSWTTAGTFTNAWSKPTGGLGLCTAIVLAAGGGGGSGRQGTVALSSGGTGAGGGGISVWPFLASQVGSAETVIVGAGGTAGAAQASASTDGNFGIAGGDSQFGTYIFAKGGHRGVAGNSTGPSSGALGGQTIGITSGGQVGPTASVNAAGTAVSVTSSNQTVVGGGAGGSGAGPSVGSGNAGGAGGVHGPLATFTQPAGGSAGGGGGTNGGALGSWLMGGSGGGGGGGTNDGTTAAGKGGNGGPGAGGGGGGGSVNGAASGAGGTGGDGFVYIICI